MPRYAVRQLSACSIAMGSASSLVAARIASICRASVARHLRRSGEYPVSVERHFTVTGFVVDGDRTLLHWHRKLGLWLPPGGHVDADEDPVQAVLREVLEETGIVGEIVPHRAAFAYANVQQLETPISMIVA